jgi:hypothetical protein
MTKLGYKQTAEHKAANSAANTGRKATDETRAKMSAAQRGNKKALGFKHTPESKAKNSAAHMGNQNALGNKSGQGNTNRRVPVGSKRHDGGYVLVKTAEAVNGRSTWEREHRVIMEQELGRSLLPTEVVHHINEIKDDNRKENLQLFESVSAHTAHHKSEKKAA